MLDKWLRPSTANIYIRQGIWTWKNSEAMAHYSNNLQQLLRQAITAWQSERAEGEELRITSSTIIVETPNNYQVIDLTALTSHARPSNSNDFLESCLRELTSPSNITLVYSEYLKMDEASRMQHLIFMVQDATFK